MSISGKDKNEYFLEKRISVFILFNRDTLEGIKFLKELRLIATGSIEGLGLEQLETLSKTSKYLPIPKKRY